MFTLFDFPVPVGTATTTEGTLTVKARTIRGGLPQNNFRVTVPLTFGRTLLGAPEGDGGVHECDSRSNRRGDCCSG